MPYTRRISVTDAVDTGYPSYQAVFVASPESVTVLAGFLGDGGHPPLHIHDVDLFYAVLEGSATVRLGHGQHQAKAGEVIYIPAGYPHGSDNQSGAAEHHLEILTPGVGPGRPFLKPVGSADEVQLPAAAPVRQKRLRPRNRDDRPRNTMGADGRADGRPRCPADGGGADGTRGPGYTREPRARPPRCRDRRRADGRDRSSAGCRPCTGGDRDPGRRAAPHLELSIRPGALSRRRRADAGRLRETRRWMSDDVIVGFHGKPRCDWALLRD
jgi:quercetin dioxygenase-like cupin family protein